MTETPDWRKLYDQSQARLAKLWLMYEQVRDERDLLREETGNTPVPTMRVIEPVVVYETPDRPSGPASERVAPNLTQADVAVPFVYNGFTLYARQIALQHGGRQLIHFFSKKTPATGHAVAKPDGYHVGVNARTGLPFLKKGSGPDGEDLTADRQPSYRPQCAALTEAASQCRNSARAGSKYCSSHFGYQPPILAKAAAKRSDTAPRVKNAPDTLPSIRH